MTDLRKAADMTLEALERITRQFTKTPSSLKDSEARCQAHKAIAALRQALIESDGTFINEGTKIDHGFDRTASHLAGEYVDTAQPKHEAIYEYSEMGSKTRIRAAKTWVGLTDDEFAEIRLSQESDDLRTSEMLRKVEAKLREKNT